MLISYHYVKKDSEMMTYSTEYSLKRLNMITRIISLLITFIRSDALYFYNFYHIIFKVTLCHKRTTMLLMLVYAYISILIVKSFTIYQQFSDQPKQQLIKGTLFRGIRIFNVEIANAVIQSKNKLSNLCRIFISLLLNFFNRSFAGKLPYIK